MLKFFHVKQKYMIYSMWMHAYKADCEIKHCYDEESECNCTGTYL